MSVLILAVCALALSRVVASRPEQREPAAPPRAWMQVTAALALALGLGLRLVDLDRSLWLDEFGTRWAVEGSIAQTWTRVTQFHGQTPLYYVLIWPLVHALGDSELVLRAPSLVLGALTIWLVYRTARDLHSTEAGLMSASLGALSFSFIEASVNARAYALAMALAALALFGFVRTVLGRARLYRWLFVAGGAGLFLAHFLSSLLMIGVLAGYVTSAEIRRRYPPRLFAADVLAQLLVAAPAAAQVLSLWLRRQGLEWIGPPDFALFLGIVIPFAVPALAAYLLRSRTPPAVAALERTCWFAIAAPVVILSAVALMGTNLLATRYLMVISVPGSILAGIGLARLATPAAAIVGAHSAMIFLGVAYAGWAASGIPTTTPRQDWREAVARLEMEVRDRRQAPVLYRPGFVEQDPSSTQDPSALLAPLRGPGGESPDFTLVPLTFSWWSPGRHEHFEQTIVPVLREHSTLYFLSSGVTAASGDYTTLFFEWLQQRFPGEFERYDLGPFVGVDLVRLERRHRRD